MAIMAMPCDNDRADPRREKPVRHDGDPSYTADATTEIVAGWRFNDESLDRGLANPEDAFP